jgi:hypothetical protein
MGGLRVLTLTLLAAALFALAPPNTARAETVYEFSSHCHEDHLLACLDQIRELVTRVKARDQGRVFCAPRAWGMENYPFSDYPLSVLEHVRLSLSAARFGKAEMPVDDAISDILKAIYPCD